MSPTRQPPPSGRVVPRREPAAEVTAEYLRALIFEGTLRPGDRIDREQLAVDTGTSQIPVREALFRLESEGAIEIVPHRGAFVAALDEETVREHWELIGLISGLAASRVAAERPADVVTELEELLGAMRRTDDPEQFNTLSRAFMRLVHVNGGTRELRSTLRHLVRQVPGNFFSRIPGSIEQSRLGYRQLLRAIRAGDPDAARQATIRYMRRQGDLVVEVLRANRVIEGAGRRRRTATNSTA